MVKSFSTISIVALMAVAHANYMPQPPAYSVVSSDVPCTTESSAYEVPTDYAPPSYDNYSPSAVESYPSSSVDMTYPTTTEECTTSDMATPYETPTPYYESTTEECSTTITDEPTPYTYTSTYTSCEVIPTVYTSEGTECTSEYSSTHYLTTTICDTTPIESPYPTTVTQSYESTYSSCVTYPTTYTSEGTEYTTETTSYSYSTATMCTTDIYVPQSTGTEYPVATGYTTYLDAGYGSSPAPSGYEPVMYPVENPTAPGYAVSTNSPVNATGYAHPPVEQSTGGAASLTASGIVALSAIFGYVIAVLF